LQTSPVLDLVILYSVSSLCLGLSRNCAAVTGGQLWGSGMLAIPTRSSQMYLFPEIAFSFLAVELVESNLLFLIADVCLVNAR
jgi:hypothetical protein